MPIDERKRTFSRSKCVNPLFAHLFKTYQHEMHPNRQACSKIGVDTSQTYGGTPHRSKLNPERTP